MNTENVLIAAALVCLCTTFWGLWEWWRDHELRALEALYDVGAEYFGEAWLALVPPPPLPRDGRLLKVAVLCFGVDVLTFLAALGVSG